MTAKNNTPDTEFDLLMSQVAGKLKELRINAGYSSYENFAWDNNINRMQYWKMEKGETNFTMKSLHKVLQAHELSISDFFSEGFNE